MTNQSGKKLTYEQVKDCFTERGYSLVSDKYVNSKAKLIYTCPKHGNKSISYNSLRKGSGCYECGRESMANNQRLTYDIVKQEFTKRGIVLLSTEYIDSRSSLRYLCEKHGEKSIAYSNFQSGQGCYDCANELLSKHRQGVNNPSWQGGITELSTYIRNDVVSPYHKECIVAANYTCEISGVRGIPLEVHHTYAFNLILRDTLYSLLLTLKPTIGLYTEYELRNIKDKFIEIQSVYKSVVIDRDIHKLFHDIYGRTKGNNTPQQFQEFRERYDNNEFADQLRSS